MDFGHVSFIVALNINQIARWCSNLVRKFNKPSSISGLLDVISQGLEGVQIKLKTCFFSFSIFPL